MPKKTAIRAKFNPPHCKNLKKLNLLLITVRYSAELCKLEIFIHSINQLLWKEPTNAVNPAVYL
jgi:hypothetical protein